MSFLELAKKRYSTRNYLAKPVSENDLTLILEAGRVAPTAANRQPQQILVVDDPESLKKIEPAANVFGAPLVLIICSDHQLTWKRSDDGKDVADIDASIVTTHMMLEAADLGLGSVWICKFNIASLREAFKIPEHIEPVNILAIGYEAGEPKSPNRHDTQRHPIADTVVRNSF